MYSAARGNTYSEVQTIVQSGDTISNVGVATLFATNNFIQAGTLVAGQVLFITAGGTFSTPATVNRSISLGVSINPSPTAITSVIGVSGVPVSFAGISIGTWRFDGTLILSDITNPLGGTGSVEGNGIWTFWAPEYSPATADVWVNATTGPFTFDTSIDNYLTLTAGYTTADVDNAITMRHFTVQVGI